MTVNDIRVVSPREALLASEMSGVYWLKGDTVTNLSKEQGLLHNDIWSVVRDDDGNIWINTTRALQRYGADASLAYFNMETGLFGDEGCIHAATQAGNGNLYFGIIPGLVEYIRPAHPSPIPQPVLVIRDPLLNGRPQPLPLAVPFAHDQNTFEFRYLCPSTSRECPPIYKTRLFPFDREWSAPSRATSVRYTNLPPGTYTFSVQANTGGGEKGWFGNEKYIVFTIQKPFWKRWWFRALQILLGLGLLTAIVNLRVRSLRKQKKKLETIIRIRTNEIEEKNRELALLSITDPLTGLKNRRFLDETIREDMSIIERERHNVRAGLKSFDEKASTLGVFMIDVDHFKRVNDLYGHEAGDTVIVEIARRLQTMMRQSDTVVRWGGEEFLIITRQSRQTDALPLTERIRQAIEREPFPVTPTQRIRQTISVGFCHYPFLSGDKEKLNWQQVVAMADTALYLAKHNGRNLVIGIQPGPTPLPGDGQELLADLESAIQNNHVRLIGNRINIQIPSIHEAEA